MDNVIRQCDVFLHLPNQLRGYSCKLQRQHGIFSEVPSPPPPRHLSQCAWVFRSWRSGEGSDGVLVSRGYGPISVHSSDTRAKSETPSPRPPPSPRLALPRPRGGGPPWVAGRQDDRKGRTVENQRSRVRRSRGVEVSGSRGGDLSTTYVTMWGVARVPWAMWQVMWRWRIRAD